MPPASSAVSGSAVPNIKGMNTAKVGPDPGGPSGPTPEWDNPEVSGAGVGSGAGAKRTSGAGKAPASRGGSSGAGASGATADGVRTRTAVESDSKSPGFGAAAKLDDKEMARISAIYAERAEEALRAAMAEVAPAEAANAPASETRRSVLSPRLESRDSTRRVAEAASIARPWWNDILRGKQSKKFLQEQADVEVPDEFLPSEVRGGGYRQGGCFSQCLGRRKAKVKLDEGLVDRSQSEKVAFYHRVSQLMKNPKTIRAFALFDGDASGTIDKSELTKVMLMLDPTPTMADADVMLQELDVNNDGVIDMWEFCSYMQHKLDMKLSDDANGQSVMEMAFGEFDVNGDGYLDAEELRVIFQKNLGPFNADGSPVSIGSTGLSDAEFRIMLNDLGLGPNPMNGLPPADRIKISDLRHHPAFLDDDALLESNLGRPGSPAREDDHCLSPRDSTPRGSPSFAHAGQPPPTPIAEEQPPAAATPAAATPAAATPAAATPAAATPAEQPPADAAAEQQPPATVAIDATPPASPTRGQLQPIPATPGSAEPSSNATPRTSVTPAVPRCQPLLPISTPGSGEGSSAGGARAP